jgi:hypothetical protein
MHSDHQELESGVDWPETILMFRRSPFWRLSPYGSLILNLWYAAICAVFADTYRRIRLQKILLLSGF